MSEIQQIETDVAIVGAGPAGSIVAWDLAKKGVNVLVLERKQEIGTPKRCAEGLAIEYMEPLGIEIRPQWALNRIKAAYIYSPSGKKVLMNTGAEGYIIERKIFEKYLATEAIKMGARYMVKTQVTGLIKENGAVTGLTAEGLDGPIKVKAKIVVGADGVDSKVGFWAGISNPNPLKDYHSGYQYEMAGIKNIEEDHLHIFFGGGGSPGGYVWIFPKGNSTANVGLGINALISKDGSRAKDYLDKFISNHPQFFEKASYLEVNCGGIPMNPGIGSMVSNGLMLVGDAAHQVNPLHGGGIGIAMEAAKIAADVSAAAIKEGDVSAQRLSEYEKLWMKKHGNRLNKLLKLRYFFEKLGSDELDKIADVIDGGIVNKMVQGDFKAFLKFSFTKAPKLLPLARKFLT
ncbi:MAG: NAD(P)/FAD-dependent oxidoreductase [Candidatus Altiarchaeota archaeon]